MFTGDKQKTSTEYYKVEIEKSWISVSNKPKMEDLLAYTDRSKFPDIFGY